MSTKWRKNALRDRRTIVPVYLVVVAHKRSSKSPGGVVSQSHRLLLEVGNSGSSCCASQVLNFSTDII